MTLKYLKTPHFVLASELWGEDKKYTWSCYNGIVLYLNRGVRWVPGATVEVTACMINYILLYCMNIINYPFPAPLAKYMMTSSTGNIFRVTGPLCGEFTGPGEFPTQRPVTRSFDVFFDLRLNKRLCKQQWGWWFETPSWSLWRQCNDLLNFKFDWNMFVYNFSHISPITMKLCTRQDTTSLHESAGLFSQYISFCHFSDLSSLSRHWTSIDHSLFIWHVSPQLSCGDTCQIWMWFKYLTSHFIRSKISLAERNFSKPHSCYVQNLVAKFRCDRIKFSAMIISWTV